MAGFKKEHLRKTIKASPLAALQQSFITHAIRGSLDETVRDTLINQLQAIIPNHQYSSFHYETRNADAAIVSVNAENKPSISSPEKSLLWAINLTFLAQKDGSGFYNSALWKQFASRDGVAQIEKERLAFYAATTGLNKDTRIK